MVKVETLQPVRLRGVMEPAGKIVEIDDTLKQDWIQLGLAREPQPTASTIPPIQPKAEPPAPPKPPATPAKPIGSKGKRGR